MAEMKTPEEIQAATEALESYMEALKRLESMTPFGDTQVAALNAEIEKRVELTELLSLDATARSEAIDIRQQELELQRQTIEAKGEASEFSKRQAEAINAEAAALDRLKGAGETTSQALNGNLKRSVQDISQQLVNFNDTTALSAAGFAGMGAAAAGLSSVALPALDVALKGVGITADVFGDVLGGVVGAGFEKLLDGLKFTTQSLVGMIAGLDNSRRAMRPFLGSVEHARDAHNEFAIASRDAVIPLEELEAFLKTTSDQFARLSTEAPVVISQLAVLEGQIARLGGAAGVDIIESLITEGGINTVDEAIERFKAMTMQMKELGVTPKQFTENFNALIPSLALFGSQSENAINKVSLAAAKSRVGVDAIVGVAEQFTTYSGAAQAIQGINAIFGKPLFTDPAALVDLFYQGGPDAVVAEIQAKLGGEVDPETAAGRAAIRSLQQVLGMGSAQEVIRMFEPDAALTGEERAALDLDPTAEEANALATSFDALNTSTATLSEVFKTQAQEVALRFGRATGIPLDQMSDTVQRAMEIGFEQLVFPEADELGKSFGEQIEPYVKDVNLILEKLSTVQGQILTGELPADGLGFSSEGLGQRVLAAAEEAAGVTGASAAIIASAEQPIESVLDSIGMPFFGMTNEFDLLKNNIEAAQREGRMLDRDTIRFLDERDPRAFVDIKVQDMVDYLEEPFFGQSRLDEELDAKFEQLQQQLNNQQSNNVQQPASSEPQEVSIVLDSRSQAQLRGHIIKTSRDGINNQMSISKGGRPSMMS